MSLTLDLGQMSNIPQYYLYNQLFEFYNALLKQFGSGGVGGGMFLLSQVSFYTLAQGSTQCLCIECHIRRVAILLHSLLLCECTLQNIISLLFTVSYDWFKNVRLSIVDL